MDDARSQSASDSDMMSASSSGEIISSARMSKGEKSSVASGSIVSLTNKDEAEGDPIAAKISRHIGEAWVGRRAMFDLSQQKLFGNSILFVILINTVILALQTMESVNRPFGYYFSVIDHIFLGVYIIEVIVKLIGWKLSYFKSGWNVFDFIVVLTSIVSWILPVLLAASVNVNTKIFRLLRLFRAVRAIRSLRVLRTISFLRSLQVVVSTVLRSIPAMANIVVLAGLVMYIFAVIGRSTYGSIDPYRFGSMGTTFFTLFRLMTLDNWSDIYNDNKAAAPDIWAYLAVYIILETFVFLNLFVAVIVNNLQSAREKEAKSNKKKKKKQSVQNPDDDGADGAYGGDYTKADPNQLGGEADITESGNLGDPADELGIDNYYPPTLSARRRELMGNYFMLLASLEHNLSSYQKQQKVLDELVDLVRDPVEKVVE